MGYDVYYQLFETKRYATIRSAGRALLLRRDPGPLLAELSDARRRLSSDRVIARLEFGPFLYRKDNVDRLWARFEELEPRDPGGPEAVERTARDEVIPTLVEACVAWRSRVVPSQTMSAGPLPEFLSAHSAWLEDKIVMSGLDATEMKELEFKHGVAAGLLSRKVLARLDRELTALPRPRDPVLRDDLAAFRRLVAAARAGKDLGLLRSLQ